MRKIAQILAVIWVATWTQATRWPVKCPANPDPSIQRHGNTCYQLVNKGHERRFGSKEEAYQFAHECPKDVCSNWVIDEVHE